MKHSWKILSLVAALSIGFAGCDKDKYDTLAFSNNGVAPTLSADVSTIAPAPADSSNVAVTYSWTDAKYATDSAHKKYIVEIDTANGSFVNAARKTVYGLNSVSFTAKELNNILLGYGFAFGVAKDMIIRVTSSYANNNEQYRSNVLTAKMTAYKVPPKIPLPASGKLFIVGGATPGGWSNPVPTPSQEMTQLDETTFAAILDLTGGQSYLFLPVNGDWSAKYGFDGSNNANNTSGDNMKAEGGDMLAPATSGKYLIIANFQTGKFSVTPYSNVFTGDVYLIGDATVAGWDNSVGNLVQTTFTRKSNALFELTTTLTATKGYLFLPTAGNWDHKYGGESKTGGTLLFDGAVPGSNTPAPDETGTYKITVNFGTGIYSVVKQ